MKTSFVLLSALVVVTLSVEARGAGADCRSATLNILRAKESAFDASNVSVAPTGLPAISYKSVGDNGTNLVVEAKSGGTNYQLTIISTPEIADLSGQSTSGPVARQYNFRMSAVGCEFVNLNVVEASATHRTFEIQDCQDLLSQQATLLKAKATIAESTGANYRGSADVDHYAHDCDIVKAYFAGTREPSSVRIGIRYPQRR